jgi:hypothetical protein
VPVFVVGNGIAVPARAATLYGHTASVCSIDFSHDEEPAATADADGTAQTIGEASSSRWPITAVWWGCVLWAIVSDRTITGLPAGVITELVAEAGPL